MEEIDSAIQEPTVVNIFRNYCIELWSRLPNKDKNKQEVIKWLEKSAYTYR